MRNNFLLAMLFFNAASSFAVAQESNSSNTAPVKDAEVTSYEHFNTQVKKLNGAGLVFAAAYSTALKAPGAPCLLYTSPSPRDRTRSRMPSSA